MQKYPEETDGLLPTRCRELRNDPYKDYGLRKYRSEKNCCSEDQFSDDIFVTVNIEQDSFEPIFELKGTSANVSAAANSFAVEVIADIDYTYVIKADWISDAAPKAPLGHKHIFYAESNPQAQERSGEIVFESSVGTLTYTVTQRPAGTEKDDWQYGNFVHRSLAMRFTADWCGYCPMMAEAFNNAKGQMSGHLEVVGMHGSGGLAFSETVTLERQFGVPGYPTGIVDGRAMIPNYNSTAVTAQAATDVARETPNLSLLTDIGGNYLRYILKNFQISRQVSISLRAQVCFPPITS